MKRTFSEKQEQKATVFLSLLAFLFSGIGLVQFLPILFMAIGHSHPIFITESHGKIQLVLHHSGNQDEHERMAGHRAHRHDLLDKVIAVSRKGILSHTDHEIEIPAFREKVTTTTKNIVVTKDLNSFEMVQIRPAFVRPVLAYFTPHAPPTTNPSLGSLRKTILLI